MQDFEFIIDEYLLLLRKVVGAIILNHHDVDEVIQNTFIKVYKNWDKVESIKNLKGWIVTIARNEAYDFCRAAKRRKKVFSEISLGDNNNNDEAATVFEYVGSEQNHQEYLVKEELSIALMNIKDVYREALVAVTIEGMTSEEACEVMNCSKTLLHWRIHKARKALKKELNTLNNSTVNYNYDKALQFCGD